MTPALSPTVRKALALALLLIAIWLASSIGISLVSARWRVQNEIDQLRQYYSELRERRVDISSLEQELASLASSQQLMRLTITADTPRGAAAKLQQLARKSLDEVNGKLSAMTDITGGDSTTVKVQVRAHVAEALLPKWVHILENGQTHIELDDITLSSRQQSEISPEIDVVLTLRAHWRSQDGSKL